MARKTVDDPNEPVREAAVLIGRALCLTIVAARASSRVEDEAIEAMDNKWRQVADKLVELAENS